MHSSGLITKRRSALQVCEAHFFSTTCSMYSSRNNFNVLITGSAALFPSPQSAVSVIMVASSSSRSRSSIVPLPATMRSKISSIRLVPSRHGTHFPQLSFWVKFIKNLATSTIQVLLSITTRPPEPIIAPIFFSESKSRLTSRCGVIRHPPEGPPICTALNSPSPLIPPPISKMTSRSVVPIGTSISPVFFTLPVNANAFVPGLFSGPIVLYHAAPFRMIIGTFA